MPSMNKVFLMGNLTRSPELRYTPSGTAICEFGIAINRRFVSNGIRKEETTFVEINVWQRQAEICSRRLQKGSLVMVEGRLRTDQWEEKETGRKRSRILVVAERVHFLAMPPREDYTDIEEEEENDTPPPVSQPKSYNQNMGKNTNYGHEKALRNTSSSNQSPIPPPEPDYEDEIHDDAQEPEIEDENKKLPF